METTEFQNALHLDNAMHPQSDIPLGILIYIQELATSSEARLLSSALASKVSDERQKPIVSLVILEAALIRISTRKSFQQFKLHTLTRTLKYLMEYTPERNDYEQSRLLDLSTLILDKSRKTLIKNISLLGQTNSKRINLARAFVFFSNQLLRKERNDLVLRLLRAPKPLNLLKKIQEKLKGKKTIRISDLTVKMNNPNELEKREIITFSEAKLRLRKLMGLFDENYYNTLKVAIKCIENMRTETILYRPTQLLALDVKDYSLLVKPCIILQTHDNYSNLSMKERMIMRRKSQTISGNLSFARPNSISSLDDPYLNFMKYSKSHTNKEDTLSQLMRTMNSTPETLGAQEYDTPVVRISNLSEDEGEIEGTHPAVARRRNMLGELLMKKEDTLKRDVLRRLKAERDAKKALDYFLSAFDRVKLRTSLFIWLFKTRKEMRNMKMNPRRTRSLLSINLPCL